ncbi:glycosyltransferase [Sphingomonas arantia]|uniref:Glycosyltransferase n=1 Tax=Sphingomonas arantia TaxID=1460676 RepID=A0ABW4TTK6_9SPHN
MRRVAEGIKSWLNPRATQAAREAASATFASAHDDAHTASEAVVGGGPLNAGRSVDDEDVRNLYRILLFREAETEAVVAAKVGQDAGDALDAFLSSEEFRALVPRLTPDNSGAALGRAVPDDLRAWVPGYFAIGGAAAARVADAQDMVQLLAISLSEGDARRRLEAHIGPVPAERLMTAAVRAIGDAPLRPMAGSTTSEDIRACYSLFLQRAPETDAVMAPRPHMPLLDTVMEAVGSAEFADRTVSLALDGLIRNPVAPEPFVATWAQERFDIDMRGGATAPFLIAAILSRPDVAARLREIPPEWPVAEVVRSLRVAAGVLPLETMDLPTRLAMVTTNLTIDAVSDIELGPDGHHVQFTGIDPWMILHPDAEARTGDLMQLRFRSAMFDGPTLSHLYLDYGDGFSEANSIGLSLDAQGYQVALIAAPQKLVRMRWDPSGESGTACIGMIEARPSSMDAYAERELQAAGVDKMAEMMRRLSEDAQAAPNAPGAMMLTRLLSPLRMEATYAAWITRNELQGSTGRALLQNQLAGLTARPMISVLVPTYNTPEPLLIEMIESVRKQVYPNWQLCIADDASTQPQVARVLERYAALDPRIKVHMRPQNGHICHATNDALALADGSWIAMLDHDDLLAPNALLSVAQALEEKPDAVILYSDEDKINASGLREQPYFKPEYSPELLLAQNYINHLSVYRTSAVRDAGGWRVGFEGSQDHDLVLRMVEGARPDQIVHIPKILYHWRAIAGSTALGGDQKNYTLDAGVAAVEDHLRRTSRDATVEVLPKVHHYRVRHALPEPKPLVSLLIPTRDKASVLKLAVDSIIEKSTYDPYEIIIIDNGSTEQETFDLFDSWKDDARIRVISFDKPFNYSEINNFGVRAARGSVIALVNNDVEVITPDWIEEMTAWALQPDIGCVGAKLYYPDLTLQHGGVIIGLGGVAGHSHKHFQHDSPGYFNRLQVHQNLSAVTAACLFVRREVYEEVGGLEEILTVAFNDVDFCLRVREAGYRNLWTPFAELYHHESISRGAEDNPEKIARAAREVAFMKERWREKLQSDPFYSPNLTYDREDFSLSTLKPARA